MLLFRLGLSAYRPYVYRTNYTTFKQKNNWVLTSFNIILSISCKCVNNSSKALVNNRQKYYRDFFLNYAIFKCTINIGLIPYTKTVRSYRKLLKKPFYKFLFAVRIASTNGPRKRMAFLPHPPQVGYNRACAFRHQAKFLHAHKFNIMAGLWPLYLILLFYNHIYYCCILFETSSRNTSAPGILRILGMALLLAYPMT